MVIGITVNNNVTKNIAVLARISSNIKNKATIRAINFTVKKVKTNTDKEIRKVYNIKKKAVTAAMKTKKAHRGQAIAQGVVSISGRPIPLIEFGAKAKNPFNVLGRAHKKSGGGVTVKIKKTSGTQLIQGAFIAITKGGRKSVFMRTDQRGAPRLKGGGQSNDPPIVTLRSISLPSAFTSKVIFRAISILSKRSFSKEFNRQIRLLT